MMGKETSQSGSAQKIKERSRILPAEHHRAVWEENQLMLPYEDVGLKS